MKLTALAQVVPIPAGARPQVPDGFSVQLVTSELHKPRVIRAAPNGDLFVADSMFNTVHREETRLRERPLQYEVYCPVLACSP